MRLKKQNDQKTSSITFRCRTEQENKIKQKANIYTDGNVSEYILYASLNFIPSKDDLEVGPKKRGRK